MRNTRSLTRWGNGALRRYEAVLHTSHHPIASLIHKDGSGLLGGQWMPDSQEVLLAHGGGGVLMRQLVRDRIVARLGNPVLSQLDDSATLDWPSSRLAFTSDSYVVKPVFFRGGDIGRLAVCGTVNDLAMVGGEPMWLSLSLIVEEGFPLGDLDRIIESVKDASDEANVRVATGDTKVVERGGAGRVDRE